MRTFVVGISGGVGRLLARGLLARGDAVGGLVRERRQLAALADEGLGSVVGELAQMPAPALAAAMRGSEAVVFAAGSNGGSRAVTDAIDGQGLETAVAAARLAGVRRFVSVSVMPEAERELDLGDEVEHYFAVKKASDVVLSRTDLDWVVLRPSLLTDGPGVGAVTLGPVALHREVTRADVAATIVELLHEPRVGRQVLELDRGTTPVREAVLGAVTRTA